MLDKRNTPYIDDHKVQGPLVYPGAGHVELAISAGINSFGSTFGFLENINFMNALFLPDEGDTPHIRLEINGHEGEYTISTRQRDPEAAWVIHSNGKMNHIGDSFRSEKISLADVRKRTPELVELEVMFKELFEGGLNLGPTFKGLIKCWRNNTESLGEVVVHESLRSGFGEFNLHPSILDACFQTAFGIMKGKNDYTKGVYIPVHIERVKFHQKPSGYKFFSYARKIHFGEKLMSANLWIFDEKENLIAEVQGFTAQYLEGSRGEVAGEMDNWFYEYQWKMKARREDDLYRHPADYLVRPPAIKEPVRKIIDEILARPVDAEYLNDFEPALDRLTFKYIIAGLRKLGIPLKKGDVLEPAKLFTKHSIARRHEKLFHHIFLLLAGGGYLTNNQNSYTVAQEPPDEDMALAMQKMREQYAKFRELTLLNRCGPYIKEVLTGEKDPVMLIFPEREWENVIDYYTEGHTFKKYNEIAVTAMQNLLSRLPEAQTVKILEIGAGTGGMTQAMLPVLPADRAEYYYTDVSHMFNIKAQERFSAYPFVQYKILDIEKDPSDQGFDLHSFDIIVASDVLHATKNLSHTLGHVKKLLAPRGILLMLEVTRAPIYLDLIFGMTEGWWLFEDERKNHCTMPLPVWVNKLEKEGFTDILPATDVETGNASAQTVFISCGPDFEYDKKEIQAKKDKILVLSDSRGIAARFISAARRQNMIITEISSVEKTSGKIGNIISSEKPDAVACFWPVDSIHREYTPELLENDQKKCVSVIKTVNEITSLNLDNPPHFYIITSGAETPDKNISGISISQATMWGMGRVIINEQPVQPLSIVDLSTEVKDEELSGLIKEMQTGFSENSKEEEVAFRGSKRFINRFMRINRSTAERAALKEVPSSGYPYYTVSSEFGILDNLRLQETDRKPAADNEVEIAVKAAALNFRDVMMALGMLSEEAVNGGLYGRNFGLECSGIVKSVGKSVTRFKPGDEVIAMAPCCLGGTAWARECHTAFKPEGFTFAEGAGLPIVYLTAYYAMNYLCRMSKGEHVLIHGAAGGVGIAAIHLAKLSGAVIHATAGSREKHEFLRSLGVENIYSSRTLEFHDQIMQKTGGRGVDVVVNSIAGKALTQSINTLAPYGRFIEIGKTDIYGNTRIGLKPFGNNLSYHAVDIDRLLGQRPEFAGERFTELMELFSKKQLPAHPCHEFPVSRVIDAFRFLGQSRQIGKVVLTMNEEKIRIAPPAEIRFRKDATYLIAGGCSGFGIAVARWMVQKGAGSIALTGRSGLKTEQDKAIIAELEKNGVQVKIFKVDITEADAVNSMLTEIKSTMPELKGVVNSAMVLEDAMISGMDQEKFLKVIRPKVNGTWNLHTATLDAKLDYFLMFSSISALYGGLGESNYAAANTFLDKFSFYRRSLGLPSVTLNWGVLGETGFVSRNEKVNT
ncbi:MAG TPA: hypothetical protein DC049_07730, partial [Spirochaetia bacterium]|nr:hypothetical protein [Spirochaetia bacterium]